MPTISVNRGELIKRLGKEFIQPTTVAHGASSTAGTKGVDEGPVLKIEVPANRYDLLCVEGAGRALRAFIDPTVELPHYRLLPEVPQYSITVRRSVESVRPYVVCAILRDVTLSAAAVKSFIDFQEKLHYTLCRRRSLVAIGTHDVDKVTPPFFFDALPADSFSLTPLNCDKEMTAAETVRYCNQHLQLKTYVSLIASSPVLPRVSDSTGRTLSLPPLINAHFCRVTGQTKNILIECTAMDINKANIVLNTVAATFSEYCKAPYTIEPVLVIYEGEQRSTETSREVSQHEGEASNKNEKNADDAGACFGGQTGEEMKKKKFEHQTQKKTSAKKSVTAGESGEDAAAAAPVANALREEAIDEDGKSSSRVRPFYPGGIYPQVNGRTMRVSLEYVRKITGVEKLTAKECTELLKKMMLRATLRPLSSSTTSPSHPSSAADESNFLLVYIPITRSDILHECDVAEDVAIAFGYNKLPIFPSPILSVVPLRALSDRLRTCISLCGYTETITFALVAAAENAAISGRESSCTATTTTTADQALDPTQYQLRAGTVRLANAKTRDFEQVRTSLIPGILKTILHNKGRRELPIKCYEIGDVCLLDSSTTTGARNLRHCCVAIADERFSGLEEVHGVLDSVMHELQYTGEYTIAELEAGTAAAVSAAAAAASGSSTLSSAQARAAGALAHLKKVLDRSRGTYKLLPSKEDFFLFGRQVHIVAQPKAKDNVEPVPKLLGVMGTVHPDTLKAFGLTMPGNHFWRKHEQHTDAHGAIIHQDIRATWLWML